MIFTPEHWIALSPIVVTGATSIVVMLAIAARRNHWWNATICVTGLNAALAAVLIAFSVNEGPVAVTPLLRVDGYALFYSALILVLTLGTATLSHAYLEGHRGNREEMYVLLALAALGGLVLACSVHLASFFLGLELLTVPLLAMAGYAFRDARALEAGVKYLILSAAGSAFLLFGMALVYLDTGTLAFAELGTRLAGTTPSAAVLGGTGMILVGVGFKLSLVPFHLWTPDVYEGAPAPVGAFLATVSKTAVFIVALRFFVDAGAHRFDALLDALTVLAIASILLGNLLALVQTNLKRLLAYSSIANIGYLLVVLIASGAFAVEAAAMFLVTYAVTVMGAFGVISLVSSPRGDRDADNIYDYRGLFWRRPFLTAILTAMMLSLAGIPVTAGFVGKFYVIAAGVGAREWWLVGAIVLGSAIGLYYYLRVVIALYLQDPVRRSFDAPLDWAQQVGGVMVLLLALLVLYLGLYPQEIIELVQHTGLRPP